MEIGMTGQVRPQTLVIRKVNCFGEEGPGILQPPETGSEPVLHHEPVLSRGGGSAQEDRKLHGDHVSDAFVAGGGMKGGGCSTAMPDETEQCAVLLAAGKHF
jgi:hypothetical protein